MGKLSIYIMRMLTIISNTYKANLSLTLTNNSNMQFQYIVRELCSHLFTRSTFYIRGCNTGLWSL